MNIYDIAKLSKVSIATVSRVINGSDRVSEKTKKKVEDVMNIGDSVMYTIDFGKLGKKAMDASYAKLKKF